MAELKPGPLEAESWRPGLGLGWGDLEGLGAKGCVD